MESFVWFSCLLPELWSLNCQELCFFCNLFAYVSKKPTADIAIYVYVSKSSRFALLDNGVDYYVMAYDLELLISWSSVF